LDLEPDGEVSEGSMSSLTSTSDAADCETVPFRGSVEEAERIFESLASRPTTAYVHEGVMQSPGEKWVRYEYVKREEEETPLKKLLSGVHELTEYTKKMANSRFTHDTHCNQFCSKTRAELEVLSDRFNRLTEKMKDKNVDSEFFLDALNTACREKEVDIQLLRANYDDLKAQLENEK
uniref:XRCC4 protein n=1 Tax=Gongylonema pulchrum TaxID=637853 RepID=A0A183DI36_9BILA